MGYPTELELYFVDENAPIDVASALSVNPLIVPERLSQPCVLWIGHWS